MTKKTRQKIYLRMAQEAQDKASEAKIASVREEWLEIAENYRALATRDADAIEEAEWAGSSARSAT